MVISAGWYYSPYGESGPEGDGGFPFRFTGQKLDPVAGLYNYKNRFYDPETGRFLQTDPIGYSDGMNMYQYVHGDPVNGRDPSGLAKSGSFTCTGSHITYTSGDCSLFGDGVAPNFVGDASGGGGGGEGFGDGGGCNHCGPTSVPSNAPRNSVGGATHATAGNDLPSGLAVNALNSGLILVAGGGVSAGPYDDFNLYANEAIGGHVIDRHVGKTDSELQARAATLAGGRASSYSSVYQAERVIIQMLNINSELINTYLQDKQPKSDLELTIGYYIPIGRVCTPEECTDAYVAFAILRPSRLSMYGFVIVTSYLE